MRLVLHVGWAKCASTSLQKFLFNQKEIIYPDAGIHFNEHLAVPLKLKGVDEWTSTWFSKEWVDQEFQNICDQVRNANKTVVLSSERLMDINSEQINTLCTLLRVHNPEFLVLRRSKKGWIESAWRHAVFVYDYTGGFEEFSAPWQGVDMGHFSKRHGEKFKVTEIDIDGEGWVGQLEDFLGLHIVMPAENRGATFDCCEALRRLHLEVGTEAFQRFFTNERRTAFSEMFTHADNSEIVEFAVPIAVGGKWS